MKDMMLIFAQHATNGVKKHAVIKNVFIVKTDQ